MAVAGIYLAGGWLWWTLAKGADVPFRLHGR